MTDALRHNNADHFTKAILFDALRCASTGPPETEVEVVAAAQKIDVFATSDPARADERRKMGWLGELFTGACLFEPFSRTPNAARIRRLIGKHHLWHQELERRAREASRAEGLTTDIEGEVAPFPRLIVISTGRPDTAIARYGCKAVRPGWYEATEGLQMSILVIAELPRTRETLMLRLLGAGAALACALDDLCELPEDTWERTVSWPNLLKFGMAYDEDVEEAERDEAEDDVSTDIQAWYETYRQKQQQIRAKEQREARDEGRREGRDEGRDEGRREEAGRALFTVLRARGIAVSDAARERILAEREPAMLERWIERASTLASMAEVLDGPAE